MKVKFKKLFAVAIAFLLIASSFSCKRSKVMSVDSHFAIPLFNDTIAVNDLIGKLDSTSNSWLRVRNDSIFAFYSDSVKNVVDANDVLGKINDLMFNTQTDFAFPSVPPLPVSQTIYDSVVYDKLAAIPFSFEGLNIDRVVVREGRLLLNLSITPALPAIKKVMLKSNSIELPSGEPLVIEFEPNSGGSYKEILLSDCVITPDDDETVSFSGGVFFEFDTQEGVEGGDYQCILDGSLNGLKFKTLFGEIIIPMDSVFNNETAVDFGINGITGSAMLPVPTIRMSYRNTFGVGAAADITKLQFFSGITGLTTNLLAGDHVDIDIEPTNGLYKSEKLSGFTDQIDALAQYTRLDFGGKVSMIFGNDNALISDTSTVDLAVDVEMPLSFKIRDLYYADTIDVDFGSNDVDISLIDEVDFFVDYNNKIPLDIDVQILFMQNDVVVDSLFDGNHVISYDKFSDRYSTIECSVTDYKLDNVLKANKIILRLGLSTKNISPNAVMLMRTDFMALRMRMLTKVSEVNIDDVL